MIKCFFQEIDIESCNKLMSFKVVLVLKKMFYAYSYI